MGKHFFLLLGFLFVILSAPWQSVKAEAISKGDQRLYVTTEEIILEIIFPAVDKKVQEEYKDEMIGWQWGSLEGMTYNNDHTYDVAVRIEVNSPLNDSGKYEEDLVKLKISPSCGRNKMNCNHDFKVVIMDYQHVSP